LGLVVFLVSPFLEKTRPWPGTEMRHWFISWGLE
jgi:hypothetical protein